MSEQQAIPSGEDADRERAEAEKEFAEELGSDIAGVEEEKNIGTAQSEASEKTPSPPEKEQTAEQNQKILAALGFKPYHDAGVTKYNIRVMNIKIGVTFNETNPFGKIWAYKIPEGDEEKDFLKNGDLKQQPLIQKYHAIQEGIEPMPETSVTGKIIEKRGKAIKILIIENGEEKEIFFGQGAVKKDGDGYFIPGGFSKAGKNKEGKEHDAKMDLPRDIRLLDYETQLEQAPAADVTKEKDELPKKPDDLAKTDLQSTEKTTMDEVIKPEESKEPTEYTQLINKYTNLLAEVTEAVFAEDRIPKHEKGYGIKFVYYSVKQAIEGNGNIHSNPELMEAEQ